MFPSFPFPAQGGRLVAYLALAALTFFAVNLAGCGRIGLLEPPAGSAQAQAPVPAPSPDQALNPEAGKPKIPPIVAPNKPFFLDFLLK